jgi:hypothetical protein
MLTLFTVRLELTRFTAVNSLFFEKEFLYMKQINFSMLAVIAFFMLIFASLTFAQSSDRDHPISLISDNISGSFIDHQKDNDKEEFYSFTAGPGELTIIFDVKRRRQGDMASISFEFLERNGSTPLLCCEGAQSGDSGTGRETASVKLTKRQTVILHITNASVGGGSFNARISGAISFAKSEKTDSDNNSDENRDNRNHSSNRIEIPASGTLRIRMKDGSTKEIDLSLVRDISVKP